MQQKFKVFLLSISWSLIVYAQNRMITVEHEAQLAKLHWKQSPGIFYLHQSHSILSLPEGFLVLLDDEARRASKILGGEEDDKNVEAVLQSKDQQAFMIVEYYNHGYAPLEGEIDYTAVLDELKKMYKGAGMEVVGWMEKPQRNNDLAAEYYAYEFNEGGGRISVVSTQAIKLGRYGAIKILENKLLPDHIPFGEGNEVEVILHAHSFDLGYRYEDYKEGDKIFNADQEIEQKTKNRSLSSQKLGEAVGRYIVDFFIFGLIIAAIFFIFRKLFRKSKS